MPRHQCCTAFPGELVGEMGAGFKEPDDSLRSEKEEIQRIEHTVLWLPMHPNQPQILGRYLCRGIQDLEAGRIQEVQRSIPRM